MPGGLGSIGALPDLVQEGGKKARIWIADHRKEFRPEQRAQFRFGQFVRLQERLFFLSMRVVGRSRRIVRFPECRLDALGGDLRIVQIGERLPWYVPDVPKSLPGSHAAGHAEAKRSSQGSVSAP